LEAIYRIGRDASLEHQLGSDKAAERGLQFILGKTRNGAQQRVRELATDPSADLRDMPH
jgi:hypothetical protein